MTNKVLTDRMFAWAAELGEGWSDVREVINDMLIPFGTEREYTLDDLDPEQVGEYVVGAFIDKTFDGLDMRAAEFVHEATDLVDTDELGERVLALYRKKYPGGA